MERGEDIFSLEQLLQACAAHPERFMWFLGAGASRTAGMPTAADLIWELKFRQFSREENHDIQQHDTANRQIRSRVQAYFDSKGAPEPFDAAEYSFFFEQNFGIDYSAQQQFLADELNSNKISLSASHRALAAMMAMGSARVVFTTNFDMVVEAAMAEVAGKSLMAFNLEGSYAALDALNAEAFPLYAKLHGDFRFRSIKNLPADLRENDAAIARAFLAAANRFGAVVTGYSGRDENIMQLFRAARDQSNSFPSGLFWTVTRAREVAPLVVELIETARAKGIKSGLVEIGTFDILMNRLWRQLPNKPLELVRKVRPDYAGTVAIPLPSTGKAYPLLRTNALPISRLPDKCGRFICDPEMTYDRLREAQGDSIPESVIAVTGDVLFWGSASEVKSFIPDEQIKWPREYRFEDPREEITKSTVMRSFFGEGLAKSLCAGRPVVLRRKGHSYYAVASSRAQNADRLVPLAVAIGSGAKVPLSGHVPEVEARWAEAVSIHIEERNGTVFLMLEPTIWITPSSDRELARDFIRARVLRRYNPQANRILDAWIEILLGEGRRGEDAAVTAFASDDYPVSFAINSRTAFSRRERRYVS